MDKSTKEKKYKLGVLLFKAGFLGVISILVYLNTSKFLKLIELFLTKLYLDFLIMPLTSKMIAGFLIISITGILICAIFQEIETTPPKETGVNQK